jgi:hypothetical protein
MTSGQHEAPLVDASLVAGWLDYIAATADGVPE